MLARTLKMTVVALALGAAVPAFAETLAIDGQVAIKPAGIETPQRGSTMSAVEAEVRRPGQQEQPGRQSADHQVVLPELRGGVRERQGAARGGRRRLIAPTGAPAEQPSDSVRAVFAAICTRRGEG